MKKSILTAFCFANAVAIATAQDTRTLIELALDEPTKISLKDIRLGDAIAQLSDQTGVRLVMPPETMKFVPYGADTKVDEVVLDNLPLHTALEHLLNPLGMSYQVRDDHIEVVPKEPLRELGRAPSWEELDTLNLLGRIEPGVNADDRKQLVDVIQFHVPVRDGWDILAQALTDVGAGPGDRVLSVACTNLGWSWTLSGKQIIIAPKQDQIRRLLNQPISLRLQNRTLYDVMQAVGREAHVRMTSDPGVLATLPIEMQRNFSLTAHRQPAIDALDSIAAYTGLGYVIEPDGVLFYDPSTAPRRTETPSDPPTALSDDPVVARISVMLDNGKSAEWLIRESELPPDLRARRETDLAKFFESLRSAPSPKSP